MNIRRIFNKMLRSVNRNLPTILSGGAIIGLGLTTYATAKTTPKIASLIKQINLDDSSKQEENQLLMKEVLIESVPVTICVVGTSLLIFSSNAISRKRIKLMGTAYNRLAKNFNDYKLAVLSGLGVDSYNKIQAEYAEKRCKDIPCPVDNNKHIFFDEFSNQTFESTPEDVIAAEYHLNRNFILRGYAPLNEFYDFLGIEHVDDGDILCWSAEAGAEFFGYQFVDFVNHEHIDEDGGKWYSIEMVFPPTVDDYLHYLDYGEVLDSQKLQGIE